MVTQSHDFQKAVVDSKKLQAKPTDDELLQVTYSNPTLKLLFPQLYIHTTLQTKLKVSQADISSSTPYSRSEQARILPKPPSPVHSISRSVSHIYYALETGTMLFLIQEIRIADWYTYGAG